MTAKEYLRQIELLNAKISRRQKQIDELHALAEGNGSPSLSERVQTSMDGDKMSDAVSKYVDLESELEEMVCDLMVLKNRIIGEIEELDDVRYVQILEKRYVDCMTFEQIAVDMHMDIRHIFRLHGYALLKFERINMS